MTQVEVTRTELSAVMTTWEFGVRTGKPEPYPAGRAEEPRPQYDRLAGREAKE
jgi:hypothetical protein